MHDLVPMEDVWQSSHILVDQGPSLRDQMRDRVASLPEFPHRVERREGRRRRRRRTFPVFGETEEERRRIKGLSARRAAAVPVMSCMSLYGTTQDEHCRLANVKATDLPRCCVDSLLGLATDLSNLGCITLGEEDASVAKKVAFLLHKNDRAKHLVLACSVLLVLSLLLSRARSG